MESGTWAIAAALQYLLVICAYVLNLTPIMWIFIILAIAYQYQSLVYMF